MRPQPAGHGFGGGVGDHDGFEVTDEYQTSRDNSIELPTSDNRFIYAAPSPIDFVSNGDPFSS